MDTGKRHEKPNPRETANPISTLFFLWTIRLFRTGLRRDLTLDDLYAPRNKDRSNKLGDSLEKSWRAEESRAAAAGRPPRLRSALVRAFGGEYALLGMLVLLADVGGRLAQPQLLGALLRALTKRDDDWREKSLAYAGGMVGVVALQTLCFNHYLLGAYHMGMRVRAATCSLIYRKALRLSQTALGDTAAGQAGNLLSNDVSRFDLVSTFLHYMWAAPLVAIGAAVLMWNVIGWPALVGVAAVLAVVPLQAYTGSLLARFRKRTAGRTDERVRFMDEVVSGIRVIKMYAWEKPFTALVRASRRAEISVLRKTSYCRAFFMTIILSITRVGLFCALLTMALTDHELTTDKVFVVLAYFNVLAHILCIMFIRGVAEVAEALVSVNRIEKFLHHEEFLPPEGIATPPEKNAEKKKKKKPEEKQIDEETKHSLDDEVPVIEMEGATLRWDPASVDPTLENVSVTAHKGELLAVVGQVGAGKSSLLHALLGELRTASGSVRVRGRLSYAPQEAWVFAASVRQNILFGLPWDARRYERVVRVCALKRDFEQLPHGDLTVVGQRGAALSGGQKARINLARAVYRDADVYLLDDPLSAVDTHVGRHLFDECINGFLRGKTRVLVTHQLQYLRDANRILLLHNGVVQMSGDFASLARQVDYASLLGEGGGDGEGDGEGGGEDDDVGDTEGGAKPDVARLLRRISSTRSRASQRSRHSVVETEAAKAAEAAEAEAAAAAAQAAERTEQSSKGRIQGKSPYVEYFRAGGHPLALLGLALLFLAAQTAVSGCDWFVSYWTKKEEMRFATTSVPQGEVDEVDGVLRKETYLYIYSGLVGSLLVLALCRSLGFYTLAMRCSERLHHTMFSSVLRTQVRFFDVNPSGRILNRFSKDMGTTDEQLPISLLDSTQIILQVVGTVVVIATVNQWVLVAVAVLAAIFWVDRGVYLRTSQNIKRLEGVAKSPVFSHLHATLQGLTTVRAFGAQGVLQDEFDRHQDLHSSAWYMFITTANAFGFSLDTLVLLYIAAVTFFLILQGGGSEGADVGLAITQAMSLTGVLQWGVRQSAEVANNIMAVERVLEYSVLEPEPNLESPPAAAAPKNWPSAGALDFDKVSLTYGPNDAPVLRELTLNVEGGEKVGVVGRTGAGKSSLLAALFRLAWRVDGSLRLDAVDTASVALQELRARLAVIPQDPVLFSGTLRRNLDPFDEFRDDALWRAVDEVELRDALPEAAGLDARVAEAGANFSVGQRQLVCLARALLRGARVLVLDEATANVDPRTDALIQRTLRAKFSDCTVLTVAHRLNTVMDSDKVLVMDAGQVAEFDHPYLLLEKKGVFHSMVAETGKAMAEQLARIAEDCYKARQR